MADSPDASPRLHRSSWIEVVRKLKTISLKGLSIVLQEAFIGRQEALDDLINSIRFQIRYQKDLDWIHNHEPAFEVDVIDLDHPHPQQAMPAQMTAPMPAPMRTPRQTLRITYRSRVMTVRHPLIISVYLEPDLTIRAGSMLVVSKLE